MSAIIQSVIFRSTQVLNYLRISTFTTMSRKGKSERMFALQRKLEDAEMQIKILADNMTAIRKEFSTLNKSMNQNDETDNGDEFKQQGSTKRALSSSNTTNSFDSKKVKLEFDRVGEYVIVHTDGACPNNGKHGAKAGIGVWWGDNNPLNTAKRTQKRNTNNAAEIQACTEACIIASQNGVNKLIIRTDSQFVIKCMTEWIKRWKKNNWKTATGKDVINKEDLVILEEKMDLLDDVRFEHVAGHSGIRGNEEADRLAVQGSHM